MCGLPDPLVKVVSYVSADDAVTYILEPLDDYTGYLEIIKSNGFDQEASDVEVDDTFMYQAANGDGYVLTFSVSAEATVISIEKRS